MTTRLLGLLGAILLSAPFDKVELAEAHDERAPYARFDAPGTSWTENPAFSNGLGRVQVREAFGFVDNTGEVILRLPYAAVQGFSEGLAAVGQATAHGWGYIDRTGSLTIPLRFTAAGRFSNGLARVKVQDHWGYIDRTGKITIPPRYDLAQDFSEGRATVRRPADVAKGESGNYVFAIIDQSGATIVTGWFASQFSDGVAIGEGQTGQQALISRDGKVLILDQKYDWILPFSEGLAAVGSGGKGGFIDKSGNLAVKLNTAVAGSLHDGLAAALVGEKWGYVDRSGAFKIKPQFEMTTHPSTDDRINRLEREIEKETARPAGTAEPGTASEENARDGNSR